MKWVQVVTFLQRGIHPYYMCKRVSVNRLSSLGVRGGWGVSQSVSQMVPRPVNTNQRVRRRVRFRTTSETAMQTVTLTPQQDRVSVSPVSVSRQVGGKFRFTGRTQDPLGRNKRGETGTYTVNVREVYVISINLFRRGTWRTTENQVKLDPQARRRDVDP